MNDEEKVTNFVRIEGIVEKNPKLSYIDKGDKFYETIVVVPRKNSEKKDYIPVILSKKMKKWNIKKEDKIYLCGELRKYRIPNKHGDAIAKTAIFAFDLLFINDTKPINEVILEGIIVEEPFVKEKDGKKFTTVILDVPRKYEHSDYISAYTVEEKAEKLKKLQIGDKVKIKGRIQSRVKTEKGMIFYEVFIKKFSKL